MNKFVSTLALTSTLALLSACGGGSTGANIQPPANPVQPYETLDSTANKTSNLGGISGHIVGGLANHMYGTGNSPEITYGTISGTLKHNPGEITVTVGNSVFSGVPTRFKDGKETDYRLDNGTETLHITKHDDFDYITDYTVTNKSTDVSHTYGTAGITTKTNDMPTAGTMTYKGTGSVVYKPTDQAQLGILGQGTSTIVANFGSGNVNAKLDVTEMGEPLVYYVPATRPSPVPMPLDTYEIQNMGISGNKFSGGTHVINNGGATLNLTGANTTSNAQGAFFGYDGASSAPDEISILSNSQGDDASLIVLMNAD